MVEFFDGTPNIIIVPPFLVDFIASSNAFMLPVATIDTSAPRPSVKERISSCAKSISENPFAMLCFCAKSVRNLFGSMHAISPMR